MNWGKGIITGMLMFMLFIIAMCIRMFLAPADEYDHHYYEKGINFDADYKRERQVVIDNAAPQIQVSGKDLQLKFKASAKGSIKLIRPANQSLDKTFNIYSDSNNEVRIAISGLEPGNWQVVLSWESNGKAYLYQQEIYLK